uniref:Uncharacterized protein n=1 Tax=Ditylenchus dipsaci TaxID=166011 RepID=A0A915DX22_9BILA
MIPEAAHKNEKNTHMENYVTHLLLCNGRNGPSERSSRPQFGDRCLAGNCDTEVIVVEEEPVPPVTREKATA